MDDMARMNALPIIAGTMQTSRYNLDGFVLHTLRSDIERQCYTQLFRDGGLEALSGAVALDHKRGGFYAWGMEQAVIGPFARHPHRHSFPVDPTQAER
jgi:hypothetical protein